MRALVLRVVGLVASVALVLGAYAQQPADSSARTYEITVVDRVPEFPGGEEAMYAFLAKNIHYPTCVVDKGTVYIAFVVDAEGAVTEAQVVKGANPPLDREALRVVSNMPMWSPGEQDGKAVRVRIMLPIKYCLN